MRESRAEVEAARRLLNRHSTATNAAGRENEPDRASELTPRVVAAEQRKADESFRGPGGGTTTGKYAQQSSVSSALNAPSRVVETDHIRNSRGRFSTRSTRFRPSDTTERAATASERAAARGRVDLHPPDDGAAEDFYRAALSTHISFITTNAADDTPSRRLSQDGEAFEGVGRKEAGGVGEACRALQGDVAGVRQVREIVSRWW